jgi:hypothetical protein
MLLRNVGKHSANDIATRTKRPKSSATLLWEPQISLRRCPYFITLMVDYRTFKYSISLCVWMPIVCNPKPKARGPTTVTAMMRNDLFLNCQRLGYVKLTTHFHLVPRLYALVACRGKTLFYFNLRLTRYAVEDTAINSWIFRNIVNWHEGLRIFISQVSCDQSHSCLDSIWSNTRGRSFWSNLSTFSQLTIELYRRWQIS